MKVAIVKYNAGNIFSVVNAVKRLGIEPLITDDAKELLSADRVIFPGQGEASNAMAYLREHNLDEVIRRIEKPLLGICIGQQLLCNHSDEGNVDCLGIFDADVRRFCPTLHEQKVPHMGWNSLELPHCNGDTPSQKTFDSPLLAGLNEGDFVYFVHSYYVPVCRNTIASTNYITPFSAALQKDNYFATQFHPEKSGMVGQKILKNFIEL